MEKRISELLSGLEAPAVELSESNVVSVDAVKEITMNKIKEYGATHSLGGRRMGKIAVIAAVLVMVLGISAGAYVGFTQHADPAGVLHSFFEQESYAKGDRIVEYESIEVDGEVYEKLKTNMPAWERMPLDEAVAEKYIYPYVYGVDSSISWGNYTLNIEAIIYDAGIGSGLLYYTIENPNGVVGYEVWVNGEVNWPVTSPYYAALSHADKTYIDESRTTDTKIYVCSYFITIEEWGELQLWLGDGAEKNRGERVAMTIMLPDEALENLSFDGGNVVLSPIGMSVDKKALGLSLTNDIDHITLRFADGSEYIVEQDDSEAFISNKAYALGNEDGSFSRILFNSVVDIDIITEVEVEGQVFKVE